jgi:hypothetical protein
MYLSRNNHLRVKKAVDLNEELLRYIGTFDESPAYKGLKLWTAWEKIASEDIRKHTDNVVFGKKNARDARQKEALIKKDQDNEGEAKTVLIYLDDSAWAAELNMQREYYRIMMERELSLPVKEVLFFVSRKRIQRM